MTMLERMARAHDREEAAQRGEPDPWAEAGEDFEQFRDERIACFVEALKAFRSPPTETLLRAYNGRKLNNGEFLRALIDAAIAEAEPR